MDEKELTMHWNIVLELNKTSATRSYEYFKGVIEYAKEEKLGEGK